MTVRKAISSILVASFAVAIASSAGLAASAFEGVWKVKDTAGQPFEITLSGDGTAKATRHKDMTGTWKEEGKAAVIRWNTGWVTRIVKEDDHYKKTALRPGQKPEVPPANTSDAEKVK
jgi:hypothetical protein